MASGMRAPPQAPRYQRHPGVDRGLSSRVAFLELISADDALFTVRSLAPTAAGGR